MREFQGTDSMKRDANGTNGATQIFVNVLLPGKTTRRIYFLELGWSGN